MLSLTFGVFRHIFSDIVCILFLLWAKCGLHFKNVLVIYMIAILFYYLPYCIYITMQGTL